MRTARLLLGIGFLFAGFVVALGQSTAPASGPATTTAASASAPTTNRVALAGIKDHATRIVYIVDHSGSMLDTFDFIRVEIKKSIDNLGLDQSVCVVLVTDDEAVSLMPGRKLLAATTQTRKDFTKALDGIGAQGSSGDLLSHFDEAFKMAFVLKPDVIFFVTDGHFDPRLSDTIARLNRKKTVRINTAAFINKEPSYEEQLQKIAKDNGGKYVFVSEKDVQDK